jgi:hypothetical protein
MKTALLGATALLLVVASAPAFADSAAIAISANTGAWGKSWNYSTQAEAENAALEECRKRLNGYSDDCKIATWTTGRYCAAVAVAHENGGVAWGADSADTLEVARNRAMAQCYTYAHRQCDEIIADICSNSN